VNMEQSIPTCLTVQSSGDRGAERHNMSAVDSKVIQLIGAELQDGPVSDVRAAELAAELGRLNAAVLRERSALRFEDEPAHFASALDGAAR
jgi:hypothetical protein